MIWIHVLERMKDSLDYLNSVAYNIQLTMETDKWKPLPGY
jgi:hypothetical protein